MCALVSSRCDRAGGVDGVGGGWGGRDPELCSKNKK